MRIIINGSHVAKLTAALAEAQGKATARTLDAEAVEAILTNAAKELGVSKTAMKGTALTYTGAKHFPNAYRYAPESTHFTAEHNGRYWVVTRITRAICPNREANVCLALSETAQTALLERMSSFYVRTF